MWILVIADIYCFRIYPWRCKLNENCSSIHLITIRQCIGEIWNRLDILKCLRDVDAGNIRCADSAKHFFISKLFNHNKICRCAFKVCNNYLSLVYSSNHNRRWHCLLIEKLKIASYLLWCGKISVVFSTLKYLKTANSKLEHLCTR